MAFTMEERIKLLRGTSLFNSFPIEHLAELASVMFEKDFPANHVILTEGEPSPNFYVIAKGEIEVSRLNKGKSIPLVVLSAGDTIGIIDAHSTAPPATATMKTLSKVSTLAISKAGLVANIAKHPSMAQELHDQADQIKKESFLRLLTPFKKLPDEQVRELTRKIVTKVFKKNEVIMSQGEEGHSCYLILSGKVGIYIHAKIPVATMGTGQLFGEMALLSESNHVRNSTVIAEEDCVLYEINEELFKSVVYSDQETQEMMMFFNTNRSRPVKKDNIIITKHDYYDGGISYIFKNPENNKYLQVSEDGLFFYNLLNGHRTLQEITLLLYEEKGIFIPEQAANLLMNFYHAGMITGLHIPRKKAKSSVAEKTFDLVKRILTAQYTLKNTDAFVTALYNKAARFIFLKPSLFLITLIIFLGIFFYIDNADHIVSFFRGGKGRYWWLLAVLPLTILTSGFHELAHAYTCKHFKREVHGFGIGWFWVAAFAFCDTTDMWMATRRERIIVNLSGCINDLALAGAASIASFLVRNTTVDIILWLYATLTYLSFAMNLNVVLEYDGYYALMDALDMPDLKRKASIWLGKLPRSFKWNADTRKILTYWSVCALYDLINIFILLIFQKWIIFQLLPHSVNQGPQYILSWILPYMIIFHTLFTIIKGVIEQRRK